MGDQVNKISGDVGLNTTSFKASVKDMQRELRVLESEFRSGAASMLNWRTSAQGLEDRIGTLIEKITIEKKIIAALITDHQLVAAAEGANSDAAQGLEIRINNATRSLNSMLLELGQDQAALQAMSAGSDEVAVAVTVMGLAVDGATAAFAGLKEMVKGVILIFQALIVVLQVEFAAALSVLEIGIGAIIGLGAAAVLAGAALVGLTFKAAYSADQLEELSIKTRISTERLQELSFIGKMIGTDLDSITGANARLIRSMQSAKDGTGAQAKAFKELGINVKNADGSLRDSNVVFEEALDALGKIKDPTEADALAMELFGKSAQELNPLIKLGAKGMEEMAAQARKLGVITSKETKAALGGLQDQLDMLVMGFQGVGSTILAAFAPFLSGMLTSATGYLIRLNDIAVASGGDFTKLATGLGGLFSDVIADIAKSAPEMLKSGLAIVQSLLDAIHINLPAVADAAVSIVNTLADFITNNLDLLGEVASTILDVITTKLLPLLPRLAGVGLGIIMTIGLAITDALPKMLPELEKNSLLIVKMILSSIQAFLPFLAEVAPDIINTVIDFMNQNMYLLMTIGGQIINFIVQAIMPFMPQLVGAAIQILTALANGLTQQMPMLGPVVVELVIGIINILNANAPLLVQAGTQLIIALLNGFSAGSPQMRALAPQLIWALFTALLMGIGTLFFAGLQLAWAVIQGWLSGLNNAKTEGEQLIIIFVMAMQKGLGQLYSIGASMVEGVWQGIQSQAASFTAKVKAFFEGIVAAAKAAVGFGSPAKKFEEIGTMSILGFSNAFFEGLDELQRQANVATRGFTASVALQAGGLGGTVSNSSENYGPFFAPIYIQGSTTAGSLGDALKGRRY